MPRVIGEVDGYTLTKKLGEGMSCKVYTGTRDGQKLAIKVYDSSELGATKIKELLEQETQGQDKINQGGDHPNVVKLVSANRKATLKKPDGRTETVAYIALELVDGCELMDLLIGHGGFNEEISRYFFNQMLKGILFCHNQGMSHRDLKPENMLVDK